MSDYTEILDAMITKPTTDPVLNAPVDSSDVLGIQRSQNMQSIHASRKAIQLTDALVGLTREQEVVQLQAQEDLEEIGRANRALLNSFTNEVNEETRSLDEALEVYDTGAMAAQTKLADIQSQGRTGFWKNPIQHLREGSEIRKTERELVKLDMYRRNAQLQKNRIYEAKDEKYRQLMDQSITAGYQSVKAKYNQNLTSLNAKRATIEALNINNREVQQYSQQLKVNLEAWSAGREVENLSGMAEYYYFLTSGGDTSGFVAERDVEAFKLVINSMPAEERVNFGNNFAQYQHAKLAGVPISLGEHSIQVSQAYGLSGAANFAMLTNDTTLHNTLNRGYSSIESAEFDRLVGEYLASDEAPADGSVSSEHLKGFREKARNLSATSTPEQALTVAAQNTAQAMSESVASLTPKSFYGEAGRAVIQASDLGEDVKAFFASDIPARAQSEAIDITADVGSEQVSYAIKLMEEMDAAGFDEIEIVDSLQTLFTEVALGNFMNSRDGDDAKALQQMGVTFGYTTDFDELENTKIPINVRFKINTDRPYTTGDSLYKLPAINDEGGVLKGFLTKAGRKEIDLSNRLDLMELRTRMKKNRSSYLRGKELRERTKMSPETAAQTRPAWYNPAF